MRTGQRVFDLLNEKNKTQADLSNHLGIGTSTVNGWRQENRNPSSDLIAPICDFLCVTTDYFLKGEDSKIQQLDSGNRLLQIDRKAMRCLHEFNPMFSRILTYLSDYYEDSKVKPHIEIALKCIGISKKDLQDWVGQNYKANPPTEEILRILVYEYKKGFHILLESSAVSTAGLDFVIDMYGMLTNSSGTPTVDRKRVEDLDKQIASAIANMRTPDINPAKISDSEKSTAAFTEFSDETPVIDA